MDFKIELPDLKDANVVELLNEFSEFSEANEVAQELVEKIKQFLEESSNKNPNEAIYPNYFKEIYLELDSIDRKNYSPYRTNYDELKEVFSDKLFEITRLLNLDRELPPSRVYKEYQLYSQIATKNILRGLVFKLTNLASLESQKSLTKIRLFCCQKSNTLDDLKNLILSAEEGCDNLLYALSLSWQNEYSEFPMTPFIDKFIFPKLERSLHYLYFSRDYFGINSKDSLLIFYKLTRAFWDSEDEVEAMAAFKEIIRLKTGEEL